MIFFELSSAIQSQGPLSWYFLEHKFYSSLMSHFEPQIFYKISFLRFSWACTLNPGCFLTKPRKPIWADILWNITSRFARWDLLSPFKTCYWAFLSSNDFSVIHLNTRLVELIFFRTQIDEYFWAPNFLIFAIFVSLFEYRWSFKPLSRSPWSSDFFFFFVWAELY